MSELISNNSIPDVGGMLARIKDLEEAMQSLGAESTAVRLDNARLREALEAEVRNMNIAFDHANKNALSTIDKLQADNAWLRELVQLFKCGLSDCEFYKHQVCVLNECPFEQALESEVTDE